jgi:hypothetical protein
MILTYFMAAITLVIAASVPPLVFAAETFQSAGSDWLAHLCARAIRLSRRFHRLVNQGVAAALARLAQEFARSAAAGSRNSERDGIRIYHVTVPSEGRPDGRSAGPVR